MAHAGERILVLSPSASRAWSLCRILEAAGLDVWPGRNVRDALVMAVGLRFTVVVTDEGCAGEHPELWQQLHEFSPQTLLFVHARKKDGVGRRPSADLLRSHDEFLLAMLLLLLSESDAAAAQAQAA